MRRTQCLCGISIFKLFYYLQKNGTPVLNSLLNSTIGVQAHVTKENAGTG